MAAGEIMNIVRLSPRSMFLLFAGLFVLFLLAMGALAAARSVKGKLTTLSGNVKNLVNSGAAQQSAQTGVTAGGMW